MLSVEGLGFSYGLNRILDNVSFEAESGQVTAVLGVNGSGKTTLLRCLMGFNDFEGKVRIDGSSIRSLPHRAFHDTVSYLLNTLTLFIASGDIRFLFKLTSVT